MSCPSRTHLTVRLVVSALFVPLIGLLLGTVVGFSAACCDRSGYRPAAANAGARAPCSRHQSRHRRGGARRCGDDAHTRKSRTARHSCDPAGGCLRGSAFSAHTALQFGVFLRAVGIGCRSFWRCQQQRIGSCATTTSTTANLPSAGGLLAAAIIAACATVMGLILLSQLTGWAVALQLVLAEGMRPVLRSKRVPAPAAREEDDPVWQVVVWLAFRVLMVGGIATSSAP